MQGCLHDNRGMQARWWSFGIWALVAGTALFWGLRLFVKAPQAPTQTVVAIPDVGARRDLTRIFGPDPVAAVQAAEPEPVADARFQLIGVVSPRGSAAAVGQGLALIAVDGKPAKAYRVGAVVDGQTVLQSVRARSAALGPRGGAVQVALDIAPPTAAATGSFADTAAPANLPNAVTPTPPMSPMPPMRPPTVPSVSRSMSPVPGERPPAQPLSAVNGRKTTQPGITDPPVER